MEWTNCPPCLAFPKWWSVECNQNQAKAEDTKNTRGRSNSSTTDTAQKSGREASQLVPCLTPTTRSSHVRSATTSCNDDESSKGTPTPQGSTTPGTYALDGEGPKGTSLKRRRTTGGKDRQVVKGSPAISLVEHKLTNTTSSKDTKLVEKSSAPLIDGAYVADLVDQMSAYEILEIECPVESRMSLNSDYSVIAHNKGDQGKSQDESELNDDDILKSIVDHDLNLKNNTQGVNNLSNSEFLRNTTQLREHCCSAQGVSNGSPYDSNNSSSEDSDDDDVWESGIKPKEGPKKSKKSANTSSSDDDDEDLVESRTPKKAKTIMPVVSVDLANSGHEKKTTCIFCRKKTTSSKLARHFMIMHRSEKELNGVLSVLAARPGNGQKKEKLTMEKKRQLQAEMVEHSARMKILMKPFHSRCNLLHNNVCEENGGAVVVGRRPRVSLPPEMYLSCPDCGKKILRKNLARHTRKKLCALPSKVNDNSDFGPRKQRNVVAESEMLNAVYLKMKPVFCINIIRPMPPGILKTIIERDSLIILRGQRLWTKHWCMETRNQYVSCKLREMARLFYAVSQMHPKIKELSQMLAPTAYEYLVDAVQELCGKKDDGYYERPSLALKIGYELKSYGVLHRFRCLNLYNSKAKLKKVDNFLSAMKFWNEDVSHFACRTSKHATMQRPMGVPLAKDLQKLHHHLIEKKQEALKGLQYQHLDFHHCFHLLSKVLMCQIILFNRKRAHEIHCMTLETFQDFLEKKELEVDHEAMALLDRHEKDLAAGKVKLLRTLGKNKQLVAVLLTHGHIQGLKELVKFRSADVVCPSNKYLFPNSALGFHNVSRALRKFAFEAELELPGNVTSPSLGKHVSTMSQLLNLGLEDRKGLADFLSHSKATHDRYYRLPMDVTILARTSKILFAVSQVPHKYKDKNLNEILKTDYDNVEYDYELEEVVTCGTEELDDTAAAASDTTSAECDLLEGEKRLDDFNGILSEESSDEDLSMSLSKMKKLKTMRERMRESGSRRWSDQQKDFLKQKFANEIKNKITVRTLVLEKLINQNPALFHNRTPNDLRHCINNIKRNV